MATETLLPGNLPLEMRRGVTFGPITLVFRDSNGVLINLTGYTARGVARPEIPSPNQFDLEPTISAPATDGKVVIEFTDEETAQLFPAGIYNYAITLTNGSAEIFGPFVAGVLTVIDQDARS